jgi:hypothetical protein
MTGGGLTGLVISMLGWNLSFITPSINGFMFIRMLSVPTGSISGMIQWAVSCGPQKMYTRSYIDSLMVNGSGIRRIARIHVGLIS